MLIITRQVDKIDLLTYFCRKHCWLCEVGRKKEKEKERKRKRKRKKERKRTRKMKERLKKKIEKIKAVPKKTESKNK